MHFAKTKLLADLSPIFAEIVCDRGISCRGHSAQGNINVGPNLFPSDLKLLAPSGGKWNRGRSDKTPVSGHQNSSGQIVLER